MQKIGLNKITQIYNKVKQLAYKDAERGKFEHSLDHISTASKIAYNFNWIYTDAGLEQILVNISSKIITKRSYIPKKGRIVFYDSFAIDNRGLTQQYLKALISWGVEFLFIIENGNLIRSKNIIKELELYSKAELFTVDSKLSQVEKMKLFYNKIVEFQPDKSFLHLKPSSVMAVSLWNALPLTTRYMVNLTDHAFWLGTSCIDYCIEFRDYGYTVSLEKRGLQQHQLLLQPYYPIIECDPFQGFPKQLSSDSIIILTGGAYYKMYGESDVFFYIMKQLVELNPKVVILIAGSGNVGPLNNFIEGHKLQDRLILIGSRNDINHVFEKSDIYLSTYPINGALMGQLAAINGKPILSFTSVEKRHNFMEGILSWGDISDWQVTYINRDALFLEAENLFNDFEYRKERGEIAKSHVITPDEFNIHLRELLETNKNKIITNKEIIEYSKFTDAYMNLENNYLKVFNLLIISEYKFSTFILFPAIGFNALFSKKVISRVLLKLKSKIKELTYV